MTKQVFIWDVDGVLIWYHPDNTNLDWRKRLNAIDALDVWEAFQRSEMWEQCLRDKTLDTREKFSAFVNDNNYKRKDYQRIFDIWLEHNTEVSGPAVHKLLELLQEGHECAIGSNQDGLRGCWLNSWLDELAVDIPRFISAEMGAAKPDENFFKEIETHYQGENCSFCLIDDKLDNIRGAEAAGWRGVYIDNRYRKNPELWHDLML